MLIFKSTLTLHHNSNTFYTHTHTAVMKFQKYYLFVPTVKLFIVRSFNYTITVGISVIYLGTYINFIILYNMVGKCLCLTC